MKKLSIVTRRSSIVTSNMVQRYVKMIEMQSGP